MKTINYYFFFLCFFSLSLEGKTLRYEDYIYEQQIRSVQFFLSTGTPQEILEYPVVTLEQDVPLLLEFDELGDRYQNYFGKILHCDRNWTRSNLAEMEYLETFNDFTVTDYQVSAGTRTPFMHYKFSLPKVSKSGNYLLVIYREGDSEDYIISRRFMVYETKVVVDMNVGFSNSVERRWQDQQVDFLIKYSSFPLDNPMQNVSVVLRQNGRWDNAKYDIKPLYIQEMEKVLDYRHFDLQNVFQGGNEYRLFDLRSVYQRGMGVGRVVNENNQPEVFLDLDTSRKHKVYTYIPDINGWFVIRHFETGMGDVESDYMPVTFFLKSPKLNGNVYVFGQLSDFKFLPEFRMQYDPEIKSYFLTRVLKQGYYNYKYFLQESPDKSPDEEHFEGSFNLTENLYDVIVYYRAIASRYDQIIGYKKVHYFGRN